MPVNDSASGGGAASDSSAFSGGASDQQVAKVIYEADVASLTDYWASPVLKTSWKGLLNVNFADFAVDDPTVDFLLTVAVMTRLTGETWRAAYPLLGSGAAVIVRASANVVESVLANNIFTVLDEAIVIVYAKNTNDGSAAIVQVDPSGGVPGAAVLDYTTSFLDYTTFANLFSIEGVDPGVPDQIARVEYVDDPNVPGRFLGRAIYGTDSSGAIVSDTGTLIGLDSTSLLVVTAVGGSFEKCVPFPKADLVGASPGTTSPTSFKVMIS